MRLFDASSTLRLIVDKLSHRRAAPRVVANRCRCLNVIRIIKNTFNINGRRVAALLQVQVDSINAAEWRSEQDYKTSIVYSYKRV